MARAQRRIRRDSTPVPRIVNDDSPIICGVNRIRTIAIAVAAGLATLGFGPGVTPASAATTDKLPDLAVLAPFDFRLEISPAGRRLLRFSTVIANIGNGPFQLFGFDPDGVTSTGDVLQVRQQVLQSDGTFRIRSTSATMMWAADGHNHFHIQDAQRIFLQDTHAQPLERWAKTGFCFLDSYPYGSTKPSRYNGASHVCQVAPNRTVPMGVSIRWGDVYRSTIALQWIDITGLPSGEYRILLVVDPPMETTGRFLESNEANNRGWTTIRLTRKAVTVLTTSAKP